MEQRAGSLSHHFFYSSFSYISQIFYVLSQKINRALISIYLIDQTINLIAMETTCNFYNILVVKLDK
jgi:hypothetical protein